MSVVSNELKVKGNINKAFEGFLIIGVTSLCVHWTIGRDSLVLDVCISGVVISSVCENHSVDFNPGLLRTSMAHMCCRTPLPGLSVPVPGHCVLNGS